MRTDVIPLHLPKFILVLANSYKYIIRGVETSIKEIQYEYSTK